MDSRKSDQRVQEQLAGIFLGGLVLWVAIRHAPHVVAGALLGAFTVAVASLSSTKAEARRHRGLGWRLLMSGLLTTASFFAVRGLLGADVQMRRLDRALVSSRDDLQAIIDYPWAVLPLGCAAALVAAGAALIWRAR